MNLNLSVIFARRRLRSIQEGRLSNAEDRKKTPPQNSNQIYILLNITVIVK